MDESSRRAHPARGLEPQVSVARVAVEAQLDYEVSKQMEGIQATQAVRSSLVHKSSGSGLPKRTSSASRGSPASMPMEESTAGASTSEPFRVAGKEKHEEYQAAKRQSAVVLDQNFRRNSYNRAATTNNSHNILNSSLAVAVGVPRRISSGSFSAASTASRDSSLGMTMEEPTAGTPTSEPSCVAGKEKHEEYQTAKRQSAGVLDQNFRRSSVITNSVTIPNSSNSGGVPRRINSGSLKVPAPPATNSSRSSFSAASSDSPNEAKRLSEFAEPSTVARVEHYEDYQTAKQESAEELDKQAKEELRNHYRNSHAKKIKNGTSSSMDASASSTFARRAISVDSSLLREQEPATIVRANTTDASGMDMSASGGGMTDMSASGGGSRRQASGDDLAARMMTKRRGGTKREHADAKVKAGLRQSRASPTTPGVAEVGGKKDLIEGSTTPPTLTPMESDAKVKAGLRQSRSTMSAPGVTVVGSKNDLIEGASIPPKLTQTESDAKVKAGLRQPRSTMSAPGVAVVGNKNDLIDVDIDVEGSSTPPKLTQTESDAKIKAGLRRSSRTAMVAGVKVSNGSLSQAESDSQVKAGLRKSSRDSMVAGVTVSDGSLTQAESDSQVKAGLRKSSRDSMVAGVTVSDGSLTQAESDTQVKAGLRRTSRDAMVAGVTSVDGEGNLAAAEDGHASTVDTDARLKRGLRASSARAPAAPGATAACNDGVTSRKGLLHNTSVTTARATMLVGASDGELTANAAVLREKERLFGGSGHDRRSARSLGKSSTHSTHTTHSTHYFHPPATYVQMVRPADSPTGGDTMEVDGAKGNKNRLWYILGVVVVIIVIAVGAVVGIRSSSSSSPSSSSPASEDGDSPLPQEATDAPQQPTESSSGSLSNVFPTFTLPADTVSAIESQSSRLPQVQAYNWLREDPNLAEYSEAQRLQRFSLMTLYYATNGEEWLPDGTTSNNWGDYDEHECNWFSLATQQGKTVCQGFDDESSLFDHYQYISLVLSGDPKLTEATDGPFIYQRVRGILPPELALLTSLQRLDIGLQKLRGPVPSNLSSTIQDLILYDNELDTLPSDVFENTHNLWLSHNDFAGSSIPTTVGLNSNLRSFFCINCMLTGTIPVELLRSKANLNLLYLEENRLTGSLPTEIGIATSLSEFRIYNNRVSGSIPTEIGLLTGVTQLWLDLNTLEGPIVSEFGSMTNLRSIKLGGNQLTGSLPTELGNLHQLRDLKLSWRTLAQDFRNRDLNGTIPMEYFITSTEQNGVRRLQSNATEALNTNGTDNTNTTTVDQTNTLAFPYLENFWLADTKITGTVPSEISPMTSLQSIRIGRNRQMTPGTIPTEFGILSNLVELDLAEDNLESTIPSELGQLVQLEVLELEGNLLSGQIPSEFTSLVSLTLFRVDGNEVLSGTVPDNLCQIEGRGIGCSNDNVPSLGETLLCGCECLPCT